MAKADACDKIMDFSTCLAGFIEEIDKHINYSVAKDYDMTIEDEELKGISDFVEKHLDPEVRDNLIKIKKSLKEDD